MGKKVLVAVGNEGLGYANRCIPIIEALLAQQLEPVLASHGESLELLESEFPQLSSYRLPTYDTSIFSKKITSRFSRFLKNKKMNTIISEENRMVKILMNEGNYHGIISDGRYGARHEKIPSVLITHQLQTISNESVSNHEMLNLRYIRKFDVCWVPDMADDPNLSGLLGHPKKSVIPITYVGPLSRFKHQNLPKVYDVMVLLSGPEPERKHLEQKLFKEFAKSDQKILFIRGIKNGSEALYENHNISIYDQLTGLKLQDAMNSSKTIIARSNYSTVMDLAALNKKAFLIPTPGLKEQEYIAKQLSSKKLAPSCRQEEFSLKHLRTMNAYKGLCHFSTTINYGELFHFFQGK